MPLWNSKLTKYRSDLALPRSPNNLFAETQMDCWKEVLSMIELHQDSNETTMYLYLGRRCFGMGFIFRRRTSLELLREKHVRCVKFLDCGPLFHPILTGLV